MGKGNYRNRYWNNGWGFNRIHRIGSSGLTWVSHSTIETVRRALNEPTARPSEATRASEAVGTGEVTTAQIPSPHNQLNPEPTSRPDKTGPELSQNNNLCVILDIDFGCQMLVWTPQITAYDLEEWFRGLTKEDVEILWSNPRGLPGRITGLGLTNCPPTHVVSVEGKEFVSLNLFHKDTGAMQTLLKKDFSHG